MFERTSKDFESFDSEAHQVGEALLNLRSRAAQRAVQKIGAWPGISEMSMRR